MKRFISFLCLSLFMTACAEKDGSPGAVPPFPDPVTENPSLPPDEEKTLQSLINTFVQQGAPKRATEVALKYYAKYQDRFDNQRYVSVLDFGRHSSKDRFFLLDLVTKKLTSYVTSHGKGSDPGHDGMAETFSNVSGSNATSMGFYQVSETYYGDHGYSVRLDGLSSTNSNARRRAIVIHGASYVQKGLSKQGRSWGCPALDDNLSKSVIDKVKRGSLLFLYAPAFERYITL